MIAPLRGAVSLADWGVCLSSDLTYTSQTTCGCRLLTSPSLRDTSPTSGEAGLGSNIVILSIAKNLRDVSVNLNMTSDLSLRSR